MHVKSLGDPRIRERLRDRLQTVDWGKEKELGGKYEVESKPPRKVETTVDAPPGGPRSQTYSQLSRLIDNWQSLIRFVDPTRILRRSRPVDSRRSKARNMQSQGNPKAALVGMHGDEKKTRSVGGKTYVDGLRVVP
jgi:hypothetical protein